MRSLRVTYLDAKYEVVEVNFQRCYCSIRIDLDQLPIISRVKTIGYSTEFIAKNDHIILSAGRKYFLITKYITDRA